MKINFAITPVPAVKARAIEVSREIARQHDTYFVLGGRSNYPHLTVYAFEIKDDLPGGIGPYLANSADMRAQFAHRLPLELTVQGLAAHQGYVGLEVVPSAELKDLHTAALETLSSLRVPGDTGAEYGMEFSEEQRANLEKYGYADAGDLYKPHMTFTRLKDEDQAAQAANSIIWDIMTFRVETLFFFASGDHGTCKQAIAGFGPRP